MTNAILINTNYTSLSDEEVVEFVHQGDELAYNFLINKYRNYIRAKCSKFFLVGADREDIVQEGLFGFHKAIRDYNDTKNASFKGFMELCVTRQIITAIKTATRLKHSPLNSSISLDKPVFDDDNDRTLLETIPSLSMDPEAAIIYKENTKAFMNKIQEVLTDLEKDVLYLYIDGLSYKEISDTLCVPLKTIDNALQRLKRKLLPLIDKNNYIDVS